MMCYTKVLSCYNDSFLISAYHFYVAIDDIKKKGSGSADEGCTVCHSFYIKANRIHNKRKLRENPQAIFFYQFNVKTTEFGWKI